MVSHVPQWHLNVVPHCIHDRPSTQLPTCLSSNSTPLTARSYWSCIMSAYCPEESVNARLRCMFKTCLFDSQMRVAQVNSFPAIYGTGGLHVAWVSCKQKNFANLHNASQMCIREASAPLKISIKQAWIQEPAHVGTRGILWIPVAEMLPHCAQNPHHRAPRLHEFCKNAADSNVSILES